MAKTPPRTQSSCVNCDPPSNVTDDGIRSGQIATLFRQCFGSAPALWARAPGRVDLMGSHTDYNQGHVLTLPIGHDTWIAATQRQDRTVRLRSVNLNEESEFSLDQIVPNPRQRWSNYARGVARELQAAGLKVAGFNGLIHSTVPMSSGLASSAALECVTATVLEVFGGWKLDRVRKALLCQKAENQFVGVDCGILDQYTSCLGEEGCALLLDCQALSHRTVKLPEEFQVMVCDTRCKRDLASSEYGRRRAQCEQGARQLGVRSLRDIPMPQFYAREAELPPDVAKRCRFVIEEIQRVLDLATALASVDRQRIAELTSASYAGACELYEIGAPAMREMMRAMLAAPGVIGARQAGAGFGGCMVAFIEKPAVKAFAASVRKEYFNATQVRPEVYPVRAAAGAGLVSFRMAGVQTP
jgi:galactokinase